MGFLGRMTLGKIDFLKLQQARQQCFVVYEGSFHRVESRRAASLCVLDLVSQICDVFLVRSTFSSGKPQGVGI
jgi:hypothetical protein